MKVLIVVDNLGPGGAQRQILEYLKYANRMKYEIVLVNLDGSYNTLAEEVDKLGYPIIGLKHEGFINFGTLRRLVSIFRQERADVVHTYLFTSDTYGRLAAKLAGVPKLVRSVRGFDLWKNQSHIWVDRLFNRFTDKIIVNVEGLRPFLAEREGLPAEEIVRIYNGVDLSRFTEFRDPGELRKELGIPEGALVVGMVARFSIEKDYQTFFEAAFTVLSRFSSVYFLAVGEGPTQDGYRQMVIDRGHDHHVLFAGLRRDIPDVVNMLDIGVLSTPKEGCPNVVMEYMVCGKPVVASDVGGCPELILNDESGYIVPPADAEALACAVVKLLEDAELRLKMGNRGKDLIRANFSSKKLAENTEEVYEEMRS